MNNIFSDMLDVSVIIYLDDILIYPNGNLSQHRTYVHEVLFHLWKHNSFAKAEKCAFHTNTVESLGYILTLDGLTMDPAKVETTMTWPVLWKVKDLQSFLGFANFYRHFIWNCSDICIPLTCLTCKTAEWEWTPACQNSFELLKKAFIMAPILMSWLLNTLLLVETDVYDYTSITVHPEHEMASAHTREFALDLDALPSDVAAEHGCCTRVSAVVC
jgi:hypothetical protein